jgi:hypothetical protein
MVLFMIGTAAGANLNLYNGTWINPAANPQAITKIEISVVDSKAHVHAWGQTRPKKDYDWGWEPASSSSDGHLGTRYQNSFCVRDVTITLTSSGRLVVKTHTRFTDTSGRPDRDDTDTLKRLLTPATQQTPKPVDPTHPKPANSAPEGKY